VDIQRNDTIILILPALGTTVGRTCLKSLVTLLSMLLAYCIMSQSGYHWSFIKYNYYNSLKSVFAQSLLL